MIEMSKKVYSVYQLMPKQSWFAAYYFISCRDLNSLK